MFEILVATSIAAVTELCKRIALKDYYGATIIVVASVIGGVGSWAVPEAGYTVVQGVIAGLGVVGIHQIARQVG